MGNAPPSAPPSVHFAMETRAAKRRRLNAGHCPICLSPNPAARPVECYHMFHLHCLLQWAAVENTCPVCREFFNHIISPSGPIAIDDSVQVDD